MGGGPPAFPQGFTCLVVLRILPVPLLFSLTGLSPSPAGLSRSLLITGASLSAVLTPQCTHCGLGSSAFARRYLRNHCCFLFLRLLRCFSSAGSRLHTMDSCTVAAALLQQVSPFGYPRISGYLLLPAAFRSLSRPSSALSAKASTLRSFCLTSSARTPLLCSARAGTCRTSLRRSSSPDPNRAGAGKAGAKAKRPLPTLHAYQRISMRSFSRFSVSYVFLSDTDSHPYPLGCLDILLEYGLFCMRFSRCGPAGRPSGLRQMKMERFELLTSCLQGRCSSS